MLGVAAAETVMSQPAEPQRPVHGVPARGRSRSPTAAAQRGSQTSRSTLR